MTPSTKVPRNLLFLDWDGVLNCQLFYEKLDAAGLLHTDAAPKLCAMRVGWLNEFCEETDTAVVVTSVHRAGKTLDELQEEMGSYGATFRIVGATANLETARGQEIKQWMVDFCTPMFGVHYFDFHRYVIIDDDDDMLLRQGPHFFQTDPYAGLTPYTLERARKFLTQITFPER